MTNVRTGRVREIGKDYRQTRQSHIGSIVYGAGHDCGNPSLTVALDGEFEYKSCPVCDKRVFDVSGGPGITVQVRLKCPHCRQIIIIPISSTA